MKVFEYALMLIMGIFGLVCGVFAFSAAPFWMQFGIVSAASIHCATLLADRINQSDRVENGDKEKQP